VYELTPAGVQALGRRIDRLAAVEARLGVRFATGIDAALGRFIQRVRDASERAAPADIEAVLDRAASEIEAIKTRGK
jgi:hypothetical protein